MPQTAIEMFDRVLDTEAFRLRPHSPFGPEGACFTAPGIEGDTNYWVYHHEEMFVISITDMVFSRDVEQRFEQAEYVGVYYYDSILCLPGPGTPPMQAGRVAAHISDGEPYTARWRAGVPVRGVAINLMPTYYERVLKEKLPGGFERIKHAFAALNGRAESPELLLVLRQLQNSRASGDIARLYYESKVAEAVAIVLAYAEEDRSYGAVPAGDDKQQMRAVENYIHSNAHRTITLSQLAAVGCMSLSKLKYTFKNTYGCTAAAYICEVRLASAKKLLEEKSLSIAQVAARAGYRKTSAFTRMFREKTGMLPREYRKSVNGIV